MAEWQSMDTAPKDGTPILIGRAGDDVGHGAIEITEWYVIEQSHYELVDGELYRKVMDDPIAGWNGNGHRATHWQELPEPPKDTE